MLCFTISFLICATIGFIAIYKKSRDWIGSIPFSILIGLTFGTLLGAFIGATMALTAPVEITEYTETYSLSPIEENTYIISDSNKFVIRQNGKLTDISREIVKLEESAVPEVIYFYEQKEFKQPWRTLMTPIETQPIITIKSVLIKGGNI